VDRVSFFAEQRRRRRQTWQVSAVCALATVLTGIPLSLVFTPVLFAVLLVVLKLVTLVVGVPAFLTELIGDSSTSLLAAYEEFERTSAADLRTIVTAALIWVLPGMATMLLLWLLMRAVFLRAGVGAALLAMGARPPRPGDLEERQLVNVVEEMAIAGGVPPPRVMLLDSPVANAAAVGSGPEDATVVVSRPLLGHMDRDQTQGVLGHLIGSTGNGDLRIALSIIAVFQTFGLVMALLKAPISRSARATLWRLLRFVVVARGHADAATEAELVTKMLAAGMEELETDLIDTDVKPGTVVPASPPGWWKAVPYLAMPAFIALLFAGWTGGDALFLIVIVAVIVAAVFVLLYRDWVVYATGRAYVITRAMVVLPYYFAVFFPQMLMSILVPFALGPLIALLWRTRRYLADATAVQLTRNPDGIAGGLAALGRMGGPIPGGAWAAPLFVVGGETVRHRWEQTLRQNPAEAEAARAQARAALRGMLSQMSAGPAAPAPDREALGTFLSEQAAQAPDGAGALGGGLGSAVSFHPSLRSRLRRLRAQGATYVEPPGLGWRQRFAGTRSNAGSVGTAGLLTILVVVLSALAAILMTVLAALLLAITLAVTGLMMLAVLALAKAMFG
jgi:Zn-dependent protease with chaperone function